MTRILPIFLIFIAVLLFLSVPPTWSQTSDITTGLIAHYKFDEGSGTTTVDSSGSGNTGTLINSPIWTTGKIGGALSFDGADDYVAINTFGSTAQTYTFSFWVNRSNSVEGENYIFDTESQRFVIDFGAYCATPNNLCFFDGAWKDGGFNVPANEWHHIALVLNSSTGSGVGFMDGIQKGSVAYTAVNLGQNLSTKIGSRFDGTINFKGLLDDFRIYNRALSAAEVEALYNGTSPPPPSSNPIDSLQPGYWYQIPNSRLDTVLPNPLPPGATGPESIMIAWSGGTFDTKRDRLIVWGGGHGDYAGNEVYAFDLAALRWSRIWGPTPTSQIPSPSPCSDTYLDGNPSSRHTYDGLEYLPNLDVMWSQGGSVWCGSGGPTYGTWFFNLSTPQWIKKADAISTTLGVTSDYDPVTQLVVSRGLTKVQTYDPVTNTWTARGDVVDSLSPDGMTGAIDPVRRKFVEVGGGAVRVWDMTPTLPAKWTSSVVSTFGPQTVVNAYSPGFVWDPVSQKLVGWSGDTSVYTFDVSTLTWTQVQAASANTVVPTNPPVQGTYGRFRFIPSKNIFILVNRINENVYMYKLSSGSGVPPPPSPSPSPSPSPTPSPSPSPTPTPPPPSGQISLPLKTWAAVTAPTIGQGPCPNGVCKHMRLAQNPVNERIYFLGGDYSGLTGLDSGRNELYSYSILSNNWILEYPYCGSSGVQPAHPDEVGWSYDTMRNIFWMKPGYMSTGTCPSTTLVYNKTMSFNPITKTWTDPNRIAIGRGESNKFTVYDPTTDDLIIFIGGAPTIAAHYDISTDTWTQANLTLDGNGMSVSNARLGEEYAAIDVAGRHIWLIEPVEGKLYRYDIDTKKIFYVTNTPVKNTWCGDIDACAWPWDSAMPIWDSVNRVLLWPHIPNFSSGLIDLHIYHPDTNTWEKDLMYQPQGITVRGNSAVFDSQQNALLVMGTSGTISAVPYLFLYRYGNGSGTPPPPSTISCHLYTPGSTIPAGYGVPWDVLSANEMLIKVTCLNATDVRIDYGRGISTQYIYQTGYHYHAGMSNWSPITLSSSESLISNNWYPKTANASLTGLNLTNVTHYTLGHICSWNGTQWKCGCRDSACTQSYWQIQSFKR